MKTTLVTLLLTCLMIQTSLAQLVENSGLIVPKRSAEPFLFSTTTLTPEDLKWSLDYSSSYGEKVTGPFGQEGVGQQVGVKGYLGKQFTVYAHAAVGNTFSSKVSSAQQVEVIRDFIGGKKIGGLRVGLGLGMRRDYSSTNSILSRATIAYDATRWKTGGNILFEKAIAANRDKIDIISSIGFHYRLKGKFYGGLEAVGEDLEGLWDAEEAEGGAKILIGPSLNMTTKNNRLSFALSGGPVFYATSNPITNNQALRELPNQSGLSLRARVIFNLSN